MNKLNNKVDENLVLAVWEYLHSIKTALERCNIEPTNELIARYISDIEPLYKKLMFHALSECDTGFERRFNVLYILIENFKDEANLDMSFETDSAEYLRAILYNRSSESFSYCLLFEIYRSSNFLSDDDLHLITSLNKFLAYKSNYFSNLFNSLETEKRELFFRVINSETEELKLLFKSAFVNALSRLTKLGIQITIPKNFIEEYFRVKLLDLDHEFRTQLFQKEILLADFMLHSYIRTFRINGFTVQYQGQTLLSNGKFYEIEHSNGLQLEHLLKKEFGEGSRIYKTFLDIFDRTFNPFT